MKMNTSTRTTESAYPAMPNNGNAATGKKIRTPVGALTLIADDTHLLAVLWETDMENNRVQIGWHDEENSHPILQETEKQLYEYFAGERKLFNLPLKFFGTDFQQQVWNALLQIPYGETRTYLQLAQQLGNRNATRAVGLANGKNPISIIVPCHRVVGANGKLTGFAGGLEHKQFLLGLENPPTALTLF